MRRGVPRGEMVSDRTEWPPLLDDAEYDALEELLAERLAEKKAEGPEPIEVGEFKKHA